MERDALSNLLGHQADKAARSVPTIDVNDVVGRSPRDRAGGRRAPVRLLAAAVVLVAITMPIALLLSESAPHVNVGGGRPDVPAKPGSSWGVPIELVSRRTYTFDPQLAVSPGGHAIAAWIQGKSGTSVMGQTSVRTSQQTTQRTTQQVVADVGTAASGFGRPFVLARGGMLDDLTLALSGAHVAYVAWTNVTRSVLDVAVLRDGRVVARHSLANAEADGGLYAVRDGRAALVWDQYGHGFPILEYGIMGASGEMEQRVAITRPASRPVVSVNTSGELVAAWTANEGASSSREGVGKYEQLIVTVCKPAFSCSAPRVVPLGARRTACLTPAVAMSPSGAFSVIATATGADSLGCTKSLGTWVSVVRHGRAVTSTRLLVPYGEQPVAASVGEGGAVMVFSHTPETLSWSMLASSGQKFAAPEALEDRDTLTPPAPALAASVGGHFVTAWLHASSRDNPQLSIRAALGDAAGLESQAVIAPGRYDPYQYQAGVDDQGNAIVLWNALPYGSGGGVGITFAIHRQ